MTETPLLKCSFVISVIGLLIAFGDILSVSGICGKGFVVWLTGRQTGTQVSHRGIMSMSMIYFTARLAFSRHHMK